MTEESKASIDGISTSPDGELPFDNTQGPNKSPQDIINDAAHEEEMAKTPPYETQMSKDDAPKNLEVEGDIGSVMDNDKRDKLNEFLDDLMKGDARIDIPIPNTVDGTVDMEWLQYCMNDNQEAHMAINMCLELLHKRLEGMEKYVGRIQDPQEVFNNFLLSPNSDGRWRTLEEQFKDLHTKMDNFEARLSGVIGSRLNTVEQNETALKFLIGTFNERLDKLEGKTDGVQPTE